MVIAFYPTLVSGIKGGRYSRVTETGMLPNEDRVVSAIHLDTLGGISGDMFAAALLDADPNLWETCEEVLFVLDLPDGVGAVLEQRSGNGFVGSALAVQLPSTGEATPGHIHWAKIKKMLETSDLKAAVRDRAINIFQILADAEAKVHGIDTDSVTFHEVGAWDSIIDVVIAAALIEVLGPCQWSVGPLPRGRGQIKSQHGVLPLPAPATAEILKGLVLFDDGEEGERVTPTGAAILKHLAPRQEPDPIPRVLLGVGSGFGQNNLKSRANLLRATFYADVGSGLTSDAIEILRCEIDDQDGEDLAIAIEHLRETDGVLDVCQWPVFGKKGRIASALQVLVRPAESDKIVQEMLNETQTLGVRRQSQVRNLVERWQTEIEGVRGKVANRPNGITVKAEMDDIAAEKTSKERLLLKRKVEMGALAEAKKNAK